MAFFDDLGKKITQAGQAVSQKTKDFTGVAKLNAAIADEEKKLQNTYSQIGRIYVSKHANDFESDFSGLIASVKESENNIVNYRQQIQSIKGLVRCEKCGAEIANNISFCSACGAPVAPAAPASYAAPAAPSAPVANPNLVLCTGCGQMISKDLKFCTSCGTPTASATQPAPAPAPAAPVENSIPQPTQPQAPVNIPEPTFNPSEPSANIPEPTVVAESVLPVSSVATRCNVCGAEVPAGMAFCQECGTKVQ